MGEGSIDMFALELAALFHDLYEQVSFWYFVLINDNERSPIVQSMLKVMTVPRSLCSLNATKKSYPLVKLDLFQRLLRMCHTARRSSE